MPSPLASAIRIVLTTDPAIDEDALLQRETDALKPGEFDEMLKAVPADLEAHALTVVRNRLLERIIKRYEASRDVAKHLVLKSDVTPAWCVVTPLRSTYLDKLDNDEALAITERLNLALRAGVHRVVDADGQVYEATTTLANKQPMADEEWVETVKEALGHGATHQLGLAVLTLSRLPAKARPTSPSSAG